MSPRFERDQLHAVASSRSVGKGQGLQGFGLHRQRSGASTTTCGHREYRSRMMHGQKNDEQFCEVSSRAARPSRYRRCQLQNGVPIARAARSIPLELVITAGTAGTVFATISPVIHGAAQTVTPVQSIMRGQCDRVKKRTNRTTRAHTAIRHIARIDLPCRGRVGAARLRGVLPKRYRHVVWPAGVERRTSSAAAERIQDSLVFRSSRVALLMPILRSPGTTGLPKNREI